MALNVERVVDGCMDGKEPLRRSPALEALQLAFSSSSWLVNEAAVVATRRNSADLTFEDLTIALERIVAGLEKKSRILTPPERRRVAYHEMGHALVAASLPGVDPVLKVSIIPRGIGALGYTIQHPTEDRFVLAASELRNRIAVLMGGRAAQDDEVLGAAGLHAQEASGQAELSSGWPVPTIGVGSPSRFRIKERTTFVTSKL